MFTLCEIPVPWILLRGAVVHSGLFVFARTRDVLPSVSTCRKSSHVPCRFSRSSLYL